jgi:hypothetical protein
VTDTPVTFIRYDAVVVNKDGTLATWLVNSLNEIARRTGGESYNALQGVISGLAQVQTQQASDRTASISRDAGLAGSTAGAGVTDSQIFSGKASSGASWVTLVTCSLTPTGAGAYSFKDGSDGQLMLDLVGDAISAGTVFNGNWRIRESDGVTPVVKDSGTFTATYTPESSVEYGGEGGPPIVITYPAFFTFEFVGLPAPADTIANTYSGAVTTLTFEIQRASGSNDISGLAGSMKVSWA